MIKKIDFCGLPIARNCDSIRAAKIIYKLATLPPAPINVFVNNEDEDDGKFAIAIAYCLAKFSSTKWLMKKNIHLRGIKNIK